MRLALLAGCLAVLTLPYATGLFFDGGITISTAALANALVAKTLIVGKLAAFGGLAALASSNRGRSSSSHHYRRPSYRHHRRRRSPLFFDGGATIAIGAGLANALVLKGLVAAKLGVAGALLASRGSSSSHRRSYSSHHRGKRSPLFFDGGATITIGAGLANAVVLKGLIAAKLGALGAGLALASRGSSSSHRRSYSSHHRRSAEVDADLVAPLLENSFLGMIEEDTLGCFERLFCEMGADPVNYQDEVSVAMSAAVKTSSEMEFSSPAATEVGAKLNRAMSYADVMAVSGQAKEDLCETVYNQCQWSGKAMKKIIAEVDKQDNSINSI